MSDDQKVQNIFIAMSDIILDRYSIITVVGPTGCGKTYFIENFLIPKLRQFFDHNEIKYLSSDKNREFIIGKPTTKYSHEFELSSKSAYDLLINQMITLTTYPASKYSKIIIVDTTGLSNELHESIEQIAENNNYSTFAFVFSLNNDDMFKYSTNKDRTRMQLKSFQEKIPNIKKKWNYNRIYHIKNFDYTNNNVFITHMNESLNIDKNDCVIIGSINGDHELLKQIFDKYNETKKIIVMGNYLGDNHQMIDLIWSFVQNGHIIMKGWQEYELFNKINDDNFDTLTESQINKFKLIWKNSLNYQKYRNCEITTSYCDRKYLDKTNKIGFENQIKNNTNCPNFKDKHDFIHIFSNPEMDSCMTTKSMISIGTGCGLGGYLTLIEFNGKHRNIKKMESKIKNDNIKLLKCPENLLEIRNIDVSQSDSFIIDRINTITQSNINYISGTICPADKDMTIMSLESLKKGLEYYTNIYNGTKYPLLSIQVKDMGSRFQFYYCTHNKNSSFGVTRNGYCCKSLSKDVINQIYDSLTPKLQNIDNFENTHMIIIDGELMPWSALGKSLIDSEFRHVYHSAKSEFELLKEFGFDEQEKKLIDKFNESDFKKDSADISKKQMCDKYGGSIYQTYKLINENKKYYNDISSLEKGLDIFGKQIEIFGTESNVYYKPFSILKIIYQDCEMICGVDFDQCTLDQNNNIGNVSMYSMLTDNKYLVIDTNDNFNQNLMKLQEFWDNVIVANNFEGIIIKPDIVNIKHAPAIKVRNSNYLHIIYGYDYMTPEKYNHLIGKKNIRDKLSTSIREYQIGINMLKINYDDVSSSNIMKMLCCDFINEETKEKTFDIAL